MSRFESSFNLLISDMDGTLVDNNSVGNEIGSYHPLKIAIDAAKAKQKHVTIATGRNYERTKPVARALGIVAPLIVNCGSTVVDASTGTPIWEKRLRGDDAQAIHGFLAELSISKEISIGLGHAREYSFGEITPAALEDLVYMDLVGLASDEDTQALAEFVAKQPNTAHAIVPSPQVPGTNNMLITHSRGTKLYGAKFLQSQLGVPKSETIVCGDGTNDLPLFEAGGIRAAVIDGDPELIEAAHILIQPPSKYGVAELIKQALI